jgi:hypothetical protein
VRRRGREGAPSGFLAQNDESRYARRLSHSSRTTKDWGASRAMSKLKYPSQTTAFLPVSNSSEAGRSVRPAIQAAGLLVVVTMY